MCLKLYKRSMALHERCLWNSLSCLNRKNPQHKAEARSSLEWAKWAHLENYCSRFTSNCRPRISFSKEIRFLFAWKAKTKSFRLKAFFLLQMRYSLWQALNMIQIHSDPAKIFCHSSSKIFDWNFNIEASKWMKETAESSILSEIYYSVPVFACVKQFMRICRLASRCKSLCEWHERERK